MKINDVVKEVEVKRSKNGTPNRDIKKEKQIARTREAQLQKAAQQKTKVAQDNAQTPDISTVSPGDQARAGTQSDPALDNAVPAENPPIATTSSAVAKGTPSAPVTFNAGGARMQGRMYPDGTAEIKSPADKNWRPASNAGIINSIKSASQTNTVPDTTKTDTAPANQANPQPPNQGNYFKNLLTKSGRQQNAGNKFVKEIADARINHWFKITGYDPSIKQDPVALQKYVQGFTKERINPELVTPPTDLSDKGVKQYITYWVGKFTVAGPMGYNSPTQTPNAEPAPTDTAPEAPAANTEPSVPAQATKAPAGQRVAVPGVGVITKNKNGKWQDPEGAVVTLSREIAELERLAELQRQNATMSSVSAKKTLGLKENVDLADVLWHKMKRAR